MIKKSSVILLATCLGFSAMAFAKSKKQVKQKGKSVATSSENEIAVLETSMGKIKIQFFSDKAPGHVKNFKDLAKRDFYNGTTFHRVIPGFMVQGGDPNTKQFPNDKSKHGMGGPGYNINAEFNDIKHERGIVSMARSSEPNSAGSQFFIVVKDSFFLDKQYTVFGKVIEGMDVADKIVSAPRDPRDNPNEKIEIKKVTLEAAPAADAKPAATPTVAPSPTVKPVA